MMVATGLPIASATPQAAKTAQADAADTAPETDGGFLGTLMQMLDMGEATPANPNPLLQAALEGTEDDTAASETEAAGLLGMAAVLAMLQPEIRAPQMPGAGGATVDALAATAGASLDAAVTAALIGADGGQDASGLLQEVVGDGDSSQPADVTATSLPSGSLATQDTSSATRPAVMEGGISRQLHAQVGTSAWSDELGSRLQLMAEKGHHAASLRLSPEHLGPLEVQISVQDDKATVWFGASNADTRAALEQALPRLRELFAAQGLSLSQSGVFQQSPQDPSRTALPLASGNTSAEGADLSEGVPLPVIRRGLIDAYA